MEATTMKLIGVMSAAVLSLTLGVAAPAYAQQEQHDQQEEEKAKPAPNEKKAQPEKPVKQEEKSTQPQEKNVKPEERRAPEQHAQEAKPEPQPAGKNRGGRIPDDRYRANFGQQHRFRVTESDYRDRHFQYGGYSFGFVGAWPSNWLYTQDVYVIEIDGMYYLCNPTYPGVNLALSFTL
jgi:hemolysin activation/secretion protein